MKTNNAVEHGFTIIELAMVLAIIGFLLAGGLGLMSSSSDIRKVKETQFQLTEAKEALVNYYLQFGSLPCPDATAPFDGREERTHNAATGYWQCDAYRGYLPYLTLGLTGNGDAWAQPIKYVISDKFTTTVPQTATDLAASDAKQPLLCVEDEVSPLNFRPALNDDVISIQDANDDTKFLSEYAAFAILSTGSNGAITNAGMSAAFSGDGGCATLSDLEQQNCRNNSQLVAGDPLISRDEVVFDDLVVWVSDVSMLSALKKSGKCLNR